MTEAPAIILVRPQLGQNIGSCARAMLNFELTDLRLVAPRDGWPNADAGPAASGADEVLAAARVYDTVQEAVADLSYVYATTVRGRELTRPVVTPAQAATEMRGRGARSGLLFGAERSGLLTEELIFANAILTVPVNPAFGSLNLAQAVLLAAYEWHRAGDATPAAVLANYEAPAPHAELEGLIVALDAALVDAGYFKPPETVSAKRMTLRNLMTRPAWSAKEVRTLRGMVTALHNGPRVRRKE
ncbi:RNA methyltransferase [Glacieibacterium frigidum]|uniref:RNA methyltransferase n=1 Tax=Glacieibacterium frigidum TaxID=2593303 RepID=A0A552U7B3_9SPHN|nr:RNA methyltransferase [Glacieibacterium frigidum]TRW14105.1 RNA methyltransferase [Glacieibacterium frigidum]